MIAETFPDLMMRIKEQSVGIIMKLIKLTHPCLRVPPEIDIWIYFLLILVLDCCRNGIVKILIPFMP